MKTFRILVLVLSFIPVTLKGQKIDNTVSYRDIKSDKYIRLNYENDVFSKTDYDYTQGVNLELVTPWLSKNPLNAIFIHPKKDEWRYGILFEHLVYTPNDLSSYTIEDGDRPYAGVMMLKSFSIATDTINKSRVVTSLSLGVIGPGANAGNLQQSFHKMLGSAIPNGWYYQIKNDVVINYEIDYEKQLVRFDNFFSLNGNATARLGTLFTNASLGLNASLGIINSPFTSVNNKSNFQLYVFSQALVNAIGYDATLQGGLLDDKSPYTIPNQNIERFTAQENLGIVLQYRWIYLEYSHTFLSREISTHDADSWGSIRCGIKL